MSKWSSPTKQKRKQRLNCIRKVKHTTFEDARMSMCELQSAGRARLECTVYMCEICNHYHWGHPTGLNGGAGSGKSHVKCELPIDIR